MSNQQITLSYLDPLQDPSMRSWELNHYGFQCVCPACVDMDVPDSFAQKSRERRWQLRDLEDISEWQGSHEERLTRALKIVALTREEGLFTPNLGGRCVLPLHSLSLSLIPCPTFLSCHFIFT
jgi:hypothetical protein